MTIVAIEGKQESLCNYRGLERVGSWVPGGSVGRDQLVMAAKVRRH